MPLKESALQQQLERAKTHLSEVEQELPTEAVPKKNAMWRHASARVRQIEGRLNTRQAVLSGAAAGGAKPEEEEAEPEEKEE